MRTNPLSAEEYALKAQADAILKAEPRSAMDQPHDIPNPNPPDDDPNEPRPQRVWLVTGHQLQPGITVNISIIGDGVPKQLWCAFLDDLRKLRPDI